MRRGRLDDGRFFLPGPTEVPRDVLEAQMEPMIGHRGPRVEALMEECQQGLQMLFRTERPVMVSTSSATGMMEAGVRNAVRRRMLALVNGAFSERFADIGEACGFEVERMEVAWGEAHDPSAVRDRLARGGIDTVTVVHSETSTGVLNPVAEIAEVVADAEGGSGGEGGSGAKGGSAAEDASADRGGLLLVDSVSGLAGAPVETDAWNLDFVLTGSQKAVALPPGLSFAAASDAVLERSRRAERKGVYFDLDEFASRLERSQTPNTPALSLLHALRVQLAAIREEGMEARWSRHAEMAERCHRWAEEEMPDRGLDLGVLAPPGRRSPTVTCVTLPGGIRGSDVASGLAERGWTVGTGYGKLKDGAIRIGHMGEHTPEELEGLLEAAAEVLVELAGAGAPAGSRG